MDTVQPCKFGQPSGSPPIRQRIGVTGLSPEPSKKEAP